MTERQEPTVPRPLDAATCRRIVVARHGGPEVLDLVAEALPVPEPGQVRIRMCAAGVGFPDLLMREGTYPGGPRPPFTPGEDVVGVVDAVGPGAGGVRGGDRVAALTVHGGYSEMVCLPVEELVAVPAGLDAAEAVSVVLSYVTAYQMLKRTARVRTGERALVHGAAGGVGSAALQLGSLAGLSLFGTASGNGLALVERLGATPIDYRSEDFVKQMRRGGGADVVLDGLGGMVSLRSYRSLARGGRLVLFGRFATLVGGRRSIPAVARFYAAGAATLVRGLVPDGRRVLMYQVVKLKQRAPTGSATTSHASSSCSHSDA